MLFEHPQVADAVSSSLLPANQSEHIFLFSFIVSTESLWFYGFSMQFGLLTHSVLVSYVRLFVCQAPTAQWFAF